jgi:hypothetical protein
MARGVLDGRGEYAAASGDSLSREVEAMARRPGSMAVQLLEGRPPDPAVEGEP